MRLLILGGTGFIGPHLVKHAVARGHKVTIFTRGRRDASTPRRGRAPHRRPQRGARRARGEEVGRRLRRLGHQPRLGAPVHGAAQGQRRSVPLHVLHRRLLSVPQERPRRVDAAAARGGPEGRLGGVRHGQGAVREDRARHLRRRWLSCGRRTSRAPATRPTASRTGRSGSRAVARCWCPASATTRRSSSTCATSPSSW